MPQIPNVHDDLIDDLLDHFLADGALTEHERRLLSRFEAAATALTAGLALIRTGTVPRRVRRLRPEWGERVPLTQDAA